MADLNQMMERTRIIKDAGPYKKMMQFVIREHDKKRGRGHGPICCFECSPAKDISEELRLPGFRDYANSRDEIVVSCSRGCVPATELKNDLGAYSRKLCRECVAEARSALQAQ